MPMTATQVFDREFLELRAKVLELAAAFDRLDRAEGAIAKDPRWQRLQTALDVLKRPSSDRAEQVQIVFSRAYEQDWRQTFGI